MAPGPVMSASTAVAPGATSIEGEIFQPWPSERAGDLPVPSVAMPPWPGAPVKFSGLIERLLASDRRDRLPRWSPSPLKAVIVVSSCRESYRNVSIASIERQLRNAALYAIY